MINDFNWKIHIIFILKLTVFLIFIIEKIYIMDLSVLEEIQFIKQELKPVISLSQELSEIRKFHKIAYSGNLKWVSLLSLGFKE